jgi:hypothetical protein
MYIVCFWSIDGCVESELPENFHDIKFKILSSSKRDLKASVLDACCTYFLYLSIGLHASRICWES